MVSVLIRGSSIFLEVAKMFCFPVLSVQNFYQFSECGAIAATHCVSIQAFGLIGRFVFAYFATDGKGNEWSRPSRVSRDWRD